MPVMAESSNPETSEQVEMSNHILEDVRITRRGVSRRRFLQSVSMAAAATGTLGLRDLMAVEAENLRRQGKAMLRDAADDARAQ